MDNIINNNTEYFVIYSRICNEDGKDFLVYAAYNDDSDAKFLKQEEEDRYFKILKFSTVNSAIIWMRRQMEWIGRPYGFYSSITKYTDDPVINIGEVIDDDLSKLVAVHRLSLYDIRRNSPDESTMTEEEKIEFEDVIELENIVVDALDRMTKDAREAEAAEAAAREAEAREAKAREAAEKNKLLR